MGIQLLSISHKAAPLAVRQLFAFNGEQQLLLGARLLQVKHIQECVILTTCNRTEIYGYVEEGQEQAEAFAQMQEIVLQEAQALEVADMRDYLRMYYGDKAVRHLFWVAAGLDSMVIGEDQILGQVKRAHEMAMEQGWSGVYLNTLFRMAVTGAKRVKTDTCLSRTPVSTASLAVKAMAESLGGLTGRTVLVIGATGKIGSIVVKNLLSLEAVQIYVASRNSVLPHGLRNPRIQVIPYENRYHAIPHVDAVVSATTSPHYTMTYEHLMRYQMPGHRLTVVDLAVPMDVERRIGTMEGVTTYWIDDFIRIAEVNNQKKQEEVQEADAILEEYELQFARWMLFQQALPELGRIKELLAEEMEQKGAAKALDQFFYQIRERSTPDELDAFLQAAAHYGKE